MLSAVLFMAVLGACVGVVLLIAARHFRVDENPLIETVDELLPGANCGACGKAGCRAFAEALVERQTLHPCPVGGTETAKKIGAVLGVEVADSEPHVARLLCQGTDDKATNLARYHGILSCTAASLLFPGTKTCPYGCLGLGSCVEVCPFDAMHIEHGIVRIDEKKCTGCGKCIAVCPKGILELLPRSATIYVACKNVAAGGTARKACAVACIGCKRCEKACADDAIHVDSFLARIDQDKCTHCGRCAEECPMQTIVDLCHARQPEAVETTAA